MDRQQDCLNFRIKVRKGLVKYTFERKFDTCDINDYIIEDGTTHIVWSRGEHPLYKVSGLNISAPSKDSGMVRVHLLKNTLVDTTLPSHVKILDILTDQVKVPAEETTYWCHVYKLSEEYKTKHHIYQVLFKYTRKKIE